MKGLNKENKNDVIKLEKYFKRYEKFHGKLKKMELINRVLYGEKLPRALRSLDPILLQYECSKIVLKRNIEEKNISNQKKHHYILAGTIAGIILASAFSFHVTKAKKENQEKIFTSSVGITEINAAAFSPNIQNQYVINQKQKKGKIKKISSNHQTSSKDDAKEVSNLSFNTLNSSVSNGALVESIHGDAIIQGVNAATANNLDQVDGVVYSSMKANKGEKIKEEDPREVVKEVSNTTELLSLYNKNIDGKKLEEEDLKILSQFDQKLISIKGSNGSYHQAASNNYVVTTSDNHVHIVFSPNVLDRDYLTGKDLTKKPDIVNYTKVSEYIEDHDLKSVGYQLSTSSFWGYTSVSKINELYGSEVVGCIQKYGLPVPVYEAGDFEKAVEKTSSVERVKKR